MTLNEFKINENEYLPYSIGALLYTPCINEDLLNRILNRSRERLCSMALCLEDSVHDSALIQAEKNLKNTLSVLRANKESYICKLFVRVRTPEHLERLHTFLDEDSEAIMGYILPKFDSKNAKIYKDLICKINQSRKTPLFFMPILESEPLANILTRKEQLFGIKSTLDTIKEYILNIRVGGNDFCNLYGARRTKNQTIYDIGVVRDILIDILNVFSGDYVVSGPVWEYFGNNINEEWATGLKKELELDHLNGFIGKTSIHPSQISLINDSLKVSKNDFEDAKNILNWKNDKYDVEASVDKSRMNEVKCHLNWAKKTLILGEIYGIKDE